MDKHWGPAEPAGPVCPICRERPANLFTRAAANGEHWCAECITEHDAIDWEAVYEARHE